MPRSPFLQGLIGSLGFLWHFGNVKCYISAKGHYLELPPSPQHAGAADAGEKWPAGKTPNWKSMFTLRLHWEDVQAAKGEFKSPFLSPHRGDTQCKGSVGAEPGRSHSSLRELQLSCWQHREGIALPASVAISQICGSSQSHLQTPNQNNRGVSLSPSLNHHHTCISPGWVNIHRRSTATRSIQTLTPPCTCSFQKAGKQHSTLAKCDLAHFLLC